MAEAHDSRRREAEIRETEADVDQHEKQCNRNRKHRVTAHLTGDGSRDALRRNLLLVNRELLRECLVEGLALFDTQRAGLDDDLIGALHLCRLDVVVTGHSRDHGLHFRINLLERHVLIEGHIGRGTALKVEAEVQRAAGLCLIDAHADKTGGNDNQRKTEEEFSLADKVEGLSLLDRAEQSLLIEAELQKRRDPASRNQKCREHRDHNAESEGRRKALDGAGAHNVENRRRNQRRDISVDNRGECLVEAGLNRLAHTPSETDFLADTGKDDDIRIDRHTYRENDTRDTRKGHRDIKRAD